MLQYSQKILWTEILAFQLPKCSVKRGWGKGAQQGSGEMGVCRGLRSPPQALHGYESTPAAAQACPHFLKGFSMHHMTDGNLGLDACFLVV